MRKGDDLNLHVSLAVDHEVRKASKRDAASPMLSTDSRHRTANCWTTLDQLESRSNFRQQTQTESTTLSFVPVHSGAELQFRRRKNT